MVTTLQFLWSEVLNTSQPRIYVAGHKGLVGAAIVRALAARGHTNIVTRSHAQLELTDQAQVREFFRTERIDQVYLAAAKVGGIHANNTYPAEFIYDNMMVQANVVHEAWRAGVHKLLFLGSSCIYPRLAPQPIREEYLMSGMLEPTNEPYAMAKIAGIKLCESYNRQYGTDYRSVMPTNLYGPGDNYHPENSHVIPALMRRFHEAMEEDAPEVVIWGSGKPMREFLFVDDMAAACVHVMSLDHGTYAASTDPMHSHINVGTGEDVTIAELARLVGQTVGYRGRIVFDTSKPDGTPRKLLDVSKLRALGWQASTPLPEGLRRTYAAFQALQTEADSSTLVHEQRLNRAHPRMMNVSRPNSAA
ncbi:GDP-L-fucose synthase [Massilia solisilvae]|uniref:GDP-L-fucose synthase n=1 Tax=Massilia solisilvae TaxID=1811225 RepID=A0ABT2BJF9_9BURK|nr:GDP-L-fucose synthase [Massilia solisilvae]MCS0608639.1 GDP-L-fucose synthase [Massilia solisilvae]